MSGEKAYVKPVDKQVTIMEENESSMQGQKNEIPIAKEVQEMMDMMQGHWVSKCIRCVIFAYCRFILWAMLISKPFAILYVITRCIWQFYIRLFTKSLYLFSKTIPIAHFRPLVPRESKKVACSTLL